MKVRRPKCDKLCEFGDILVAEKHSRSGDIKSRIMSLREQWQILNELAATRKKQLDEAAEAYQVYCFKTITYTNYS